MKKIKFLILTILLFIIDQIIKNIIVSNNNILPKEVIKNILYISYCENRGIAFGMGQGSVELILFITLIIISFIVIYIFIYYYKFNKIMLIGMAFTIAGGLGNLYDRAFRSYVIDYIDFSEIVDFPIFNFADICIVVGVIIIGISYLKNEGGEVNERINSWK